MGNASVDVRTELTYLISNARIVLNTVIVVTQANIALIVRPVQSYTTTICAIVCVHLALIRLGLMAVPPVYRLVQPVIMRQPIALLALAHFIISTPHVWLHVQTGHLRLETLAYFAR